MSIRFGRVLAAFAAFLLLAVAVPTSAQVAGAGRGGGSAALTAARFELTIDGHSLATFSELVAISSTATPAGIKPTVTLRRAMTRNIEIAAWHELVILGDVAAARKSVSMTIYAADGNPVARYHLTDAWPAKLEITTLKAGASEVLMETVTLTCEFIQRVSV